MSNIFKKYHKKTPDNYLELINTHSPYVNSNIALADNIKFSDIMYNLKSNPEILNSKAALMRELRIAKKKTSILAAINDIRGKWETTTTMRNLSIFADYCIELALKYLINEAFQKDEIETPNISETGLSIIAIGKLGSHELNYSSDIDLIFIYDKEKSNLIDKSDCETFYKHIAEQISEILSKLTIDGYVFRVDTKIRPDHTTAHLAIDLEFAKDYYNKFGQSWEKTTMIKARHVSGDFKVGNRFIKFIDKWVWKDIPDDNDILNLLTVQEYNAHKENDDFIDIKHDPFMIRDIELFIKTTQIINGSKGSRIKSSNTLEAIHELANLNVINDDDASDLANIYLFLRDIEHRLQMKEDKQSYKLSRDSKDLEEFAEFMGYRNTEDFTTLLEEAREQVEKIFLKPLCNIVDINIPEEDLIFSGIKDNERTIQTLTSMGFKHPKRITSSVRNWLYGRYDITGNEQAKYKIIEAVPSLLEAMSKTYNPDDAFNHFDNLLQHMPEGLPIFSLFIKKPEYMNLIVNILGSSKVMATHLDENPRIISEITNTKFFDHLQSYEELVDELNQKLENTKNYKAQLDSLYIFVNNKNFQAIAHLMQKTTSIIDVSKYMSDIAEAVINCILPYIHKDFEESYGKFEDGEFALIAIGSLGAKQFTINSDLDFIPVYHLEDYNVKSDGNIALTPEEYYIKLTQKIINDISNGEHKIYEIDPRIRPEGDTGPIASSIESFIKYQQANEDSWEYTSLIKGRIISKYPDIRQNLLEEIEKIISTPKDQHLLHKCMLQQRKEIKDRFTAKSIWDVKYIDGGILDISFITKYLILKSCSVEANANNILLSLEKLIKFNLIDAGKGNALLSSYKLLQKTNFFLKFVGTFPFSPRQLSENAQKIICQYILEDKNAYSIDDLEGKINLAINISKEIYDEIFTLEE